MTTKSIQQKFREDFVSEALSFIADIEIEALNHPNKMMPLDSLSRILVHLHSIRGASASAGLPELSAFVRAMEEGVQLVSSSSPDLYAEIISLLRTSNEKIRLFLSSDRFIQSQSEYVDEGIAGKKTSWEELIARARNSDIGTQPVAAGLVAKTLPTSQSGNAGKRSVAGKGRRDQDQVRVNSTSLDSVLELVRELVVIKSQIMEDPLVREQFSSRVGGLLGLLDKNVRDLYDKALALRMSTVQPLLQKLERSARDAAMKVNKEIDFVVSGEDFEMDRALIDQVSEPLMHLVRNAVDHGLESTQGRINSKKPLTGKISVDVYQSGGGIVFDISDDGRGLDREKIIERAVERKLLDAGSTGRSLTDQEVYELLFQPGFSTMDKVSELSGRGVGLDIVKSAAQALKGHASVTTKKGQGSRFLLRLPMTAAIADGLIVKISDERFIVPLDVIEEVIDIDAAEIVTVEGAGRSLNLHGVFIPVLDIGQNFGLSAGNRNLVAVLRMGAKKVAVLVDEIVGQSQVVVKSLHDALQGAKGVAGAAIMGDGKISLALDVAYFTQLVGGN